MEDTDEMKRLLMEEYDSTSNSELLAQHFPGLVTEYGSLPLSEVRDRAIIKALRTGSSETVGPFASGDNTCALVRILDHGEDQCARVNCIYLSKVDGTIDPLRARADSILRAVKDGWSFSEAAMKYSLQEDRDRGGDMGWFRMSSLVTDFADTLRQHQKGDLYTVWTEQYGWYVVQVTEEPANREYVEYVLGRGPICP